MSEIHVTVKVCNREPNQDRLRIADRYIERANQVVSRSERQALDAEADRIYREETR